MPASQPMQIALKQVSDLVLEFLFDIFRFPWWWYSGGLKHVGGWCWRGFNETRARVALGLFARYLFKPMYQDYSLTGRLLSFVMRLILIVIKLVRLGLSLLWYGLIVTAWLLLLPFSLIVIFS